MEDRPGPQPWRPKTITIAVLDSDETLADALCALLRDGGFVATPFYDLASLTLTHRAARFHAYVLDSLAAWRRDPSELETLVASIRDGTQGEVPVFILGNQVAPERSEALGRILMHHQVRYILRPVSAGYIAAQVRDAVARWAGL